jgi:hypothetical protein
LAKIPALHSNGNDGSTAYKAALAAITRVDTEGRIPRVDREELAQAAVTEALATISRPTWRGEASLETVAYRIATRLAQREIARTRVEGAHRFDVDPNAVAANGSEAERAHYGDRSDIARTLERWIGVYVTALEGMIFSSPRFRKRCCKPDGRRDCDGELFGRRQAARFLRDVALPALGRMRMAPDLDILAASNRGENPARPNAFGKAHRIEIATYRGQLVAADPVAFGPAVEIPRSEIARRVEAAVKFDRDVVATIGRVTNTGAGKWIESTDTAPPRRRGRPRRREPGRSSGVENWRQQKRGACRTILLHVLRYVRLDGERLTTVRVNAVLNPLRALESARAKPKLQAFMTAIETARADRKKSCPGI